MLVDLERLLNGLGGWLIRSDLGLGLLLVVGISMSLSPVFGLCANSLVASLITWPSLLVLVVAVSYFQLYVSTTRKGEKGWEGGFRGTCGKVTRWHGEFY